MAAPRSIWNGTLELAQLAVPVKLFSATQDRAVHFREVRLSDGCRIEHRRVGADSGREVPRERIAKAYETSRGQRVVMSDEEIAAARGAHAKAIAIEHFVHAAEIDPVYYERPYILGAQAGGERAYQVLLAALARSELVGIGRVALRSREQLVALRPHARALTLYTMRFAEEVVDARRLKVPDLAREPSEREIEMAERLIDTLAVEWQPEEHEDHYRDAVLGLIARKAAGESVREPKPPREPPTEDLLAALQASIESAPHKRGPRRRGSHDLTGRSADGTTHASTGRQRR